MLVRGALIPVATRSWTRELANAFIYGTSRHPPIKTPHEKQQKKRGWGQWILHPRRAFGKISHSGNQESLVWESMGIPNIMKTYLFHQPFMEASKSFHIARVQPLRCGYKQAAINFTKHFKTSISMISWISITGTPLSHSRCSMVYMLASVLKLNC